MAGYEGGGQQWETDNTLSGLRNVLHSSYWRLTGRTTILHPEHSDSKVIRFVIGLPIYPMAVIGAIVFPLIWLTLVTAYSPAVRAAPRIANWITDIIYLSIIFALVPTAWLWWAPDFILGYHGIVDQLVPL